MTIARIITYFLVLVFSITLSAQDIHFSQFNASPLNLNPALTGVMDGDLRIAANRRSQWSQILGADAYTTTALSIDVKKPLKNKDFLGLGVSGFIDRAGELSYGNTNGKGSIAYHKNMSRHLNRSSYLVVGLEYGVTKSSVDLSDARWPSQHNGNGGFDTLSSAPVIPGLDSEFLFGDLSAGIVWTSVVGHHKSYYLGFALHHLNQPNVSFFGSGDEQLTIRRTIHGGGEWALMEKISLVPSFIYMLQGEHKEFNFGIDIRKYLSDKTSSSSLQVGFYYRSGNQVGGGVHSDAIIFTSRVNIKDMVTVGFSYDKTISTLAQAGSANGAFEFSLGYMLDQNRAATKQYPVY